MVSIIEYFEQWRGRRSDFQKVYGVAFPQTSEDRIRIESVVKSMLASKAKSNASAQKNLEKVANDLSSAAVAAVAIILAGSASCSLDHCKRLARWAGFSRDFIARATNAA